MTGRPEKAQNSAKLDMKPNTETSTVNNLIRCILNCEFK